VRIEENKEYMRIRENWTNIWMERIRENRRLKQRYINTLIFSIFGGVIMPAKVTLKDEKILDSWSILIENAQGRGKEIYEKTKRYIEESQAPGIKTIDVKVRPSWLKGLLGKEREYLRVENTALKDFKMYVGARDYGNNLDVQWYLTCEPGFFKKRLSRVLTSSEDTLSFLLDIFKQQDLRAYATVVHHALLKAVIDLMSELEQDSSKIDRKSRGFLGIS